MANNFKIQTHKHRDEFHLWLRGDFDGSSAFELICELKRAGHPGKIVIHTDGLNKVLSFGSQVFESNLYKLSGSLCKIHFAGKNKHHFMVKN